MDIVKETLVQKCASCQANVKVDVLVSEYYKSGTYERPQGEAMTMGGDLYCRESCLSEIFGKFSGRRQAVGVGTRMRAKTHKDYEGDYKDY